MHRRWYLAPGPGRVGRRWIHAPHEVNLVGGFFYAPFRLAATLSRPRLVNTSRLSLTGPPPGRQGAPSFLCAPFRLAAALPPKGGHAHVSAKWSRVVATARSPSRKSSRRPFLYMPPGPCCAGRTHVPPRLTLPVRPLAGTRRAFPNLSCKLAPDCKVQKSWICIS